jgi:hypothetical protein
LVSVLPNLSVASWYVHFSAASHAAFTGAFKTLRVPTLVAEKPGHSLDNGALGVG